MSLSSDVAFAVRTWTRQPRLAATAVVTLALGIGGATTMYGVLQAIGRFGQPTVPQPEEVGRIFTAWPQDSDGRMPVSLTDYHRWQQAARSLETLAAYTDTTRVLRTANGRDEGALAVTPSFLALPKTPPVVGRFFTEDDARASGGRLAVLSERAWRSRFGADPGVVGRTLDLDGHSYTVIGVATEHLGLVMGSTGMFVPLIETEVGPSVRVIARRAASVSWEQVRAEMKTLGVGDGKTQQVRIVPIMDDARYRTRTTWLGLVGPAVLVLLIGCGNLASLLLVRAVEREREMATRLALGASRRQLALQLLIEGWSLAVAGGVLGSLLAALGLRGVRALIPADFHLAFDTEAVLFASAATLLTPLVFGVAPLVHSLRVDLSAALRSGSRKPLFGVRQYHLRDLFAILEVSLSVGLLMFTFMLLSLFSAFRDVGFSFDANGLVVCDLATEGSVEGRDRLIRERVATVPGVRGATVGDPPLGNAVVRVGRGATDVTLTAREVRVDETYFGVLGLPVLRGRGVGERDGAGTPPVCVVSEGLAARAWPAADPVGQVLRVVRDGKAESVTVVGVTKGTLKLGRLAHVGMTDAEGIPYTVYRPSSQVSGAASTVIARVDANPGFPAAVADAVRAADPRVRVRKVVSLASTLERFGHRQQGAGPFLLLLGFGGLALLLAVIGVFGVMRQLVDERRAEMGIRLALGASPEGLMRSVVGDGLIRVGVGAGIAVVFVSVTTRLGFADLLTVSAADPLVWLGVLTAVALTAAAACVLPARRAGRIDPMVTLRCE